ncbi:MAG TPA: hypothetical protein VM600_09420, partial [Actinomycetota bacterium]|nr:hypothetical protein [Actinomycetota bacterium]
MTIDPHRLPEMPELMIVGPGELHDSDLEVLGRQVIAHYGDVWTELHTETLNALGNLLGSAETPYLIPGSGTTCLDAALLNLFEPGDTVVVANTGFFGNRLLEIAKQQRLETIEIGVEVGHAADPQQLGEAARASGAAGVLLTHVDTST